MSPQPLSELVGRPGVSGLLYNLLQSATRIKSVDVATLTRDAGITKDTFSDLGSRGVLSSSEDGFYLSQFGQKTALLLKAINNDDSLGEVLSRLTGLYPDLKPYELITHDVTNFFVTSLLARPDFMRVYICSPWIMLDEEHLEKIAAAFNKNPYFHAVQIVVVTLPVRRYTDPRGIKTLRSLKLLGADIFTHEKLHAKLYITEPGPRGGAQYAIFGSENLTGRKNIELGLKIENHNELLRKLADFFRSIQMDDQTKVLQAEEL